MSVVAVFDIGKTNVKLFAATGSGTILEELSAPNRVQDGPPYRHHDLDALEGWLLDGLADLGRRHPIEAIVACSHGSGGVLVGPDGAAMPMIDYEQDPPPDITADYAGMAGSFRDRGSAVMLGSAHLARQMLWLERGWPNAFARATAFLALSQYWAFRLCGVAASEVTSLAAQSHLWSGADGRPTPLVARRGWERLLPPMRPAFETLGTLKPELARRCGLPPGTRVVCGIHDSSANFYRYQAAGLSDLTVISTGTWIVALTDRTGVDLDTETPGLSCNADVFGRPVPGILTMGGREFAAVADGADGPATLEALRRCVASRTVVLPSFGADDGLFPGTARRGRIHGPLTGDPSVRFTLALLYAALLANQCLQALPASRTVVLDGGLVRNPLFGAIMAALNPTVRVLVDRDPHGTATGAALLATHEARRGLAPLAAEAPDVYGLPDLLPYWSHWRDLTHPRSPSLMTLRTDDALREEMVATCRRMNESGINQGTAGNLSVRNEGGFLVTPTSLPYDRMQPEDLVQMSFDGTYEGPRRPSSEWRFHRDILAARPDVDCVLHCHSVYATTLAVHHHEIPSFHYMTAVAGGTTIRCSRYATFGTQALSDAALEALEDRLACLLGQHGQIALGRTMAGALALAIEVETLSRLYVQARVLGEPPVLPDEEMARVIQQMKNMSYGHAPDLDGVNDTPGTRSTFG